MTGRWVSPLGGALLPIGVLGVGCSVFETVGLLAPDAGPLDAPVVESRPDAGAGSVTLDDCQAGASGLDAGTLAALMGEGQTDGGVPRWLYPYDGTVFPGGLAAPLLMWDDGGRSEDAVYVKMHSSSFDYRACSKPTAQGRLQLSQEAWAIAETSTTGAADPFTIELSVLSGGQVFGPITERVVIARGSLQGSIYYMTLGSMMAAAGDLPSLGESSIVRVRPGQSPQLVLGTSATGCVGCHSVSAGGTRLVAYAYGMGASYALATASPPSLVVSPTPGGETPGLTPDGALYVASAHPTGVGPQSYGASVMSAGLYETATGNAISGSGIPTGAMVPAFSPDGALLVFNDFAIQSGHGLALMDFSEATRAATGYRTLLADSTNYPAWPSFLPDGKAVVFQLGAGSDFSGAATGVSAVITAGPQSDLYLVDATSHTVTMLARAMGFDSARAAASGATYLPFGSGDVHQNYYPSVSPAASGGYAWVFFDSRRHYGNDGLLRQIWGAAIDVSAGGTYAADPSHPAFFLPGQELGTGNFRAVAALDP